MTTLHDGVPPQKKLVTYGKTTRRKAVAHGFDLLVHNPTIKQLKSAAPNTSSSASGPRRAKAAMVSTMKDIFDVPIDEDEDTAAASIKRVATPPRFKTNRQRRVTKRPEDPVVKDVVDVIMTDGQVPKRSRNIAMTTSPKLPAWQKPKPSSPGCNNIFDILGSDQETPRAKRKLGVLSAKVENLKTTPKSSTKTLPPASIDKNMPDVSSIGEEAIQVKPHCETLKKATTDIDSEIQVATQASTSITDERSKKKLKLSPAHDPLTRHMLPRAHSPRIAASKKSTGLNVSPSTRESSKTSSRTAYKLPIQLPIRKQQTVKSHKLNLAPRIEKARVPALLQQDHLDLMNMDQSQPTSPKDHQTWDDLLMPEKGEDQDISGSSLTHHDDCINMAHMSSSKIQNSVLKPAIVKPRRRLIDTLVQQAKLCGSFDEDSFEASNSDPDSPQPLSSDDATADASRSQSLAPEPYDSRIVVTDCQSAQISQGAGGPKFTYSRQRSMLAEEDLMKELAIELPTGQAPGSRRNRRGSIPKLQPLSFNGFNDDDDDGENQMVIKSVHELRKSGANKRFVDECTDFLDRIGSPGKSTNSIRRSGLVDLASKMKDKTFTQQFRANSMEQQLFVHMGQETDMVAGFFMISILVAVLMEGPMPHIVAHLQRQGITRLIIRLLDCEVGIAAVCNNRKTNMSKIARSLVQEHHDYLLESCIWKELKPQFLSPRTLALKCLEMMVRQTRESDMSSEIFSKELTTNLFTIMKSASDEESWDLPKNEKAINFSLAVEALQSHSVAARTVQDESIWISEYLPILANTLEIVLPRPLDTFCIHFLLLKITLQITSNNKPASDVFARPSLLAILSRTLLDQFHTIHNNISDNIFATVLEYLFLLLGVLMNFSEWSSSARDCLQRFQGEENDPIEEMMRIFVHRSEQTSEAVHENETLKNVALAYLAVTLGYLTQHPDVDRRVGIHKHKLVHCIDEFLAFHRIADRMVLVDDEESNDVDSPKVKEGNQELTARLEALLKNLKGS